MNLDKFNFPRGGRDVGGYASDGSHAATPSGPEGWGRDGPWAASTFRLALVHELRAPLQVLQGHLDALWGVQGSLGDVGDMGRDAGDLGGESGAMAPRERLGAMRNMLGVVASAVDDVLQLGQNDVTELPLRETVFEVRACLDAEVDAFAGAAQVKGLVLECQVPADVPVMIWGDAARLRQILRTLLDNALKYTVCGGVAVKASWSATSACAAAKGGPSVPGPRREVVAGQLTLHVSDTGPGIPAGMENAVFAAFARADRSVPGTGLGLWIAQQWARRMGGSLAVEPATTGARFRLSVPFARPGAAPSSGVAGAASPGAPGALASAASSPPASLPAVPVVHVDVRPGLHALVVDDHVMNRAILADQLTALGCIVEHAGDLTGALLRWASHEVDVVLTDVQLGGACGLTLAKTLRALAPVLGRPAPVVFAVTGSVVGARAASEAGIDGVLTKPVSRQRLAQTLAVRWPCAGSERDAPSVAGKPPKAARPPLQDDPYARRVMREEMAKDLARFRRLMASRRAEDIEAAQALLHRMRGACRMFGDPALTSRCDRLAETLAASRIAPDDQT
ncbi:hybrid sensor histidine kinase/response regulator [Pandoraea terrigena]|uniref:histidine kinase n=1 Tax=Pandoraea terrigena TaxID=2508292 RepID=A0A5E4VI52_9BURK|nr:hybrid sensor histidine kinase/response regulator [Pandoraea terrigena]VVE11871.1 Sensory/regulatory protein RpfC [Pandoraea terrigena]